METHSDLTWPQLRRLAVLAGCDPRTVRGYFSGRCYSTTAERVESALVTLGLSHLIRPHSESRALDGGPCGRTS